MITYETKSCAFSWKRMKLWDQYNIIVKENEIYLIAIAKHNIWCTMTHLNSKFKKLSWWN
jgi:hypothetical protein